MALVCTVLMVKVGRALERSEKRELAAEHEAA